MIVEERMRTFINSLDPGEPAWLDEIRSSALQDNVPIIRMEMGSLTQKQAKFSLYRNKL